MFESPAERQAAATLLFRRAVGDAPVLDHVGGLADVTLPAADVRANPRLRQLRARLERRPAATHVAILTPADIAALKPGLVVRSRADFAEAIRRAAFWFFAAFWMAHLLRRWRGAQDDPLVLPVLLMLSGIGLMSMIALRDPLRDTLTASTFANGIAGGLVLLLAASEVDFEASPLRRAVIAPLGLALGLAALLLVLGTGPGTSGVKVNLFGVQPVEAIRLLVVFALAAYFARRLDLLRELSEPPTRDASLAARPARAALEGRSSGRRQHGARARVLLPPEGSRSGAGAVVRGDGAVRDRARTRRVRLRRLRPAVPRLRRGLSDRASVDGRPAGLDLAGSLEQRRAGRQPDRARAVGPRDRIDLGQRPGTRQPAIDSCRPHGLRAGRRRRGARIRRRRGGRRALRDPELAMSADRRTRTRGLHRVSGCRRRARARRPGLRDRQRPARAVPARRGCHAVSQLRALVDARQLLRCRRRARRGEATRADSPAPASPSAHAGRGPDRVRRCGSRPGRVGAGRQGGHVRDRLEPERAGGRRLQVRIQPTADRGGATDRARHDLRPQRAGARDEQAAGDRVDRERLQEGRSSTRAGVPIGRCPVLSAGWRPLQRSRGLGSSDELGRAELLVPRARQRRQAQRLRRRPARRRASSTRGPARTSGRSSATTASCCRSCDTVSTRAIRASRRSSRVHATCGRRSTRDSRCGSRRRCGPASPAAATRAAPPS